jgi:MSHA biogenesis protein MshQ
MREVLAILICLTCTLARADGLPAPVASFPMNESNWSGAAPQVLDATGNGHSGTVVGHANTVSDSRFGQVGSFNGNGQYVDVGGSYSMTGARSIVAWIDVPAFSAGPGNSGMPIVTGGASNAGDFFGVAGPSFAFTEAGVPQYALYIDHWGTPLYASDLVLTPGQWTQVAMTYDGSDTVDFYLDGEEAGSVTSAGLYNYNIDTYTIGGNAIGGTTTLGSLSGRMHDVQIYNQQLTANQVSLLYSEAPEPATLALLGSALLGFGVVHALRGLKRPGSQN